ncbi:hypothetical protein [Terribacillus saccharophilus]|uniref:hypothetical protein n=1 Tax=Terribacillus saccharophilus TaxID=361277 RepID=UPI002989B819|nr:hypothetical protein [Terribacillus saccharophilus]MCM3227577.1 hypothetical protein [Terribacillus saccharophilus]
MANGIDEQLILDNVVVDNMVKELYPILNGLQKTIQKYSYLHHGDAAKTQEMIVDAFINRSQRFVEDEELKVNRQVIYDSIPESVKEKLINNLIEIFTTQISLDSIMGKEEKSE